MQGCEKGMWHHKDISRGCSCPFPKELKPPPRSGVARSGFDHFPAQTKWKEIPDAMFIKRGGVCWVVEANLSPVTNPPNPAALRSLWGHIPVGLGMPRMPWADLDSPSELPWDHLQKICWISTLCSGLWPCGVWGKGSFLQSLLSFLSLFLKTH